MGYDSYSAFFRATYAGDNPPNPPPPPPPKPKWPPDLPDPVARPRPVVKVWRRTGAAFRLVSGGLLAEYLELRVEERRNGAAPWSLKVPLTAEMLETLAPGRWVTVDAGQVFTGQITRSAPSQERGTRVLEVSGVSGFAHLGVTMYPDPTEAAEEQTIARYRRTGPAETVLRDLIAANLTRIGSPAVVAASQGRGATVEVSTFFGSLAAEVTAKADAGGVTVTVGLVETSGVTAQLRVGFTVPRDLSRRVVLSPELGTVTSWKSEQNAPAATRAVVVGPAKSRTLTIASVDPIQSTFTLAGSQARPIPTGTLVRFGESGTLPEPLEPGRDYYVIRSANVYGVATTRARALSYLPEHQVTFSSAGSGTRRLMEYSRLVRAVVDEAAESAWGMVREVFVDARDMDDGDESEAAFVRRGREALAEAAAASAFELEVSDAEGLQLGRDYGVGDRVTVRPIEGLDRVEQVGAVQVESTPSAPLGVKVVPGNPDVVSPGLSTAALIRALRQRIRTLEQEA